MKSNAVVCIERCDSYDRTAVRSAVQRAVDRLGGMERFVRPGARVLIKPNLLSAKTPDRAVTTHPEVVRAVAEMVLEAGAVPRIGDSPSAAYKGIEHLWQETGMRNVADELNVELVSFEKEAPVRVQAGGMEFYLARPVVEADAIVSLPKFKTHSLCVFTGAIKNLYGTLPGMMKAEYHRKFPKPQSFNPILPRLYEAVKPAVSIMDAVVGMEGDGPAAGAPKQIGAILASEDAVALDSVCAHIAGLDPLKVPALRLGAEQGIGVADLDRIRVVGTPMADVKPARFRLARTTPLRFLPEFLLALVRPFVWIRPRFGPACQGCGLCVKKCPVQALRLENKRPVLDANKCIECLCCHELCPSDAVDVDMSFLVKLVSI